MKVLGEFEDKCEENTEVEDDETTKKKRLEKQKQEELDQFMLALDKMKQGEKDLYKPLSSKFKKLALISRLVFAMRDSGEEEGKDEDEVAEEKNGDLEEGKEGNKKDKLGSPSVLCAMDLAKSFVY